MKTQALAAAAAVGCLSLTIGIVAQSQAQAPAGSAMSKVELVAVPASGKVNLDGRIDEWASAPEIKIALDGGHITQAHELSVRAMYDAEHVYFLYRWNDPTESLHRKPWEKQADGSWKQLATVKNDEQKWYEDKLAVFWAINAPTFKDGGCAASCHVGVGKDRFGVMKAPAGELFDVWHWKATRTNPVGQVDDMYLDDTEYSEKTPEAGRKADPRTGGGYGDNVNQAKNGPGSGPADGKPAPHYLMKANATPFSDVHKPGDRVAGIIIAAMEGDRGDVLVKGTHDGKGWTLEVQRKRMTPSKFDVQFDDLGKTYLFSPAIFDSVQVRHAMAAEVYALRFRR